MGRRGEERRQRLKAEIDPEARTLAVMQIEAEHGRAGADQIAFVPARQIAAGIPLQERMAVPQCRRDQKRWNDNDRDPGKALVAYARTQGLRGDAASLHLKRFPRKPAPDLDSGVGPGSR
jgi:hypothetical protein